MTPNDDSKRTARAAENGGLRALCAKLQAFEARKLKGWQVSTSPKRAAVLQLVVALIFAILIILSSFLLRGTDHHQTVTYFLIAIWFVPSSLLADAAGASTCHRKSDA